MNDKRKSKDSPSRNIDGREMKEKMGFISKIKLDDGSRKIIERYRQYAKL